METKYNLAALDIGTNSFHLIVVSAFPNGKFEIIDREREVIRLSEGNTGDIKIIQPNSIERAVSAIDRFNEISKSHNADMRATATSAAREAGNRDEFRKIILNKTGVNIEIINGLEEARLIFRGIQNAVPIFDKKSLAVDIGGGSTEFILGKSGSINFATSLKLGAVRLTQQFYPNGILSEQTIDAIRQWVEGEITPLLHKMYVSAIDAFVGSSGTILNVGMMILARRNSGNSNITLNNFEFSVAELFEIENEVLSRKTSEERLTIPGLEEKRADIIPAGVIILSTIFRMFNIKKMIISEYALREGIILDSMDKLGIGEGDKKLHSLRMESIKHLAESSSYDYNHCYHVARLSLQLFDELIELHHLGETEREYLEAASILHDIGYHISHSQHHKHSYYIIRNSSILGFNDSEIEIIANVARYHRKSHPKKSHENFKKISKNEQSIVYKLSTILRVSDSLDRTHMKKVESLSVATTDKTIQIILNNVQEDIGVELWSLERRKALFEVVFDKKISVIV